MSNEELFQMWVTGQIEGMALSEAEMAQRAAVPMERFMLEIVPSHPQLRAIVEQAAAKAASQPGPFAGPGDVEPGAMHNSLNRALLHKYGGGDPGPGPGPFILPPNSPR